MEGQAASMVSKTSMSHTADNIFGHRGSPDAVVAVQYLLYCRLASDVQLPWHDRGGIVVVAKIIPHEISHAGDGHGRDTHAIALQIVSLADIPVRSRPTFRAGASVYV